MKLWNRSISEGYNTWSKTYESEIVPKIIRRGHTYSSLAEKISKQLNTDAPGHNILEVGAGTGLVGEHFKKTISNGYGLTALDISPGMLSQAERKCCYDMLIVHRGDSMPFLDGSLPMIYTTFMFHQVLHKNKALREFSRVLAPGGVLVIVDLFRTRRRLPVVSWWGDFFHSLRHEYGAPSSYISREELKESLRGAGYEIKGEQLIDGDSDVAKIAVANMEHGMIVATPADADKQIVKR